MYQIMYDHVISQLLCLLTPNKRRLCTSAALYVFSVFSFAFFYMYMYMYILGQLPFAGLYNTIHTYPSSTPSFASGPQPHWLQERSWGYTGRYADSKGRKKATPVKTPFAGIFALLTAASSLVSPFFCFSYVSYVRSITARKPNLLTIWLLC